MKTIFLRLIALLVLLLCVLAPACAFAVTGQELAALRGERSYPQALDLPGALLLSDAQDASSPTRRRSKRSRSAARCQRADLRHLPQPVCRHRPG